MDEFPLTAVPLVSPHLRERLRTQVAVTKPMTTQRVDPGTGTGGLPTEPPLTLNAGDQVLFALDWSGFGVYRDGKPSERYEIRDDAFRPVEPS